MLSSRYLHTLSTTIRSSSLALHDALPISFGPYTLDPARRLLWRDGALVQLTPKTIDVLAVLVERHGQVVGKSELLRSEEHTSELQSPCNLVCRPLVGKNIQTIGNDTSLNC